MRAFLILAIFLSLPQLAAAEPLRSPWHWRAVGSGALMVSDDQLGWLAYDKAGFLADLQLAYAVLPWLDVQVGSNFGLFLSEQDNGGLAAPTLGALARLHNSTATPYALLDVAGAFTGDLFLPMLRFGLGVEIPIAASIHIGPQLGLSSVLYSDDPGSSTDAAFISLGLAVLYAPVSPRPLPRTAAAPPPPPVTRVVEVRAPTSDLMQLVDRAVPGRTDRVELLAPVLFAFDSDVLEPVGVAMLHEVSRALAERGDLELIEVRAYADARGSADYNRELAERRGQRVFDWLVEHGIDPARLTIAPVGAGEFVESGTEEAAHEQNRRVVFRVLRATEKP